MAVAWKESTALLTAATPHIKVYTAFLQQRCRKENEIVNLHTLSKTRTEGNLSPSDEGSR